MVEQNELLTVDEAAAKLRVNSDTVRRLMRQNKLPGVKVGGQWRISATVLSAFKGGDSRAALPSIDPADKPRNQALTPAQRSKLLKKASTDPKWKNKTTGAKKVSGPKGE